MEKFRCKWCNLSNPLYVRYHDEEWCVPRADDGYLFEMLLLECFQAGLSWECVLNKRENFRRAFDEFDINRVCAYDEAKVAELLSDPGIIRNRQKINAAICNAGVFKAIVAEFGSFRAYLEQFFDGKVMYEVGQATNEVSDRISADLKKRGMKFVGSKIIYAYLQAIGVIYSHEKACFLYKSV